MAAILTAKDVVRRIAAECAYVDERGGVGIRLEPAAAIVYREAMDHDLDLAIVERAAVARREIVDRRTIFEVAFAHSPSLGQACRGQAVGRVFGMSRFPTAVARRWLAPLSKASRPRRR